MQKQNPWEIYKGMPEYISKNKNPKRSIIVHFETENDVNEFAKLVNQQITEKTKYIYYPKQIKMSRMDKIYEVSE